jgi:hypothetical protein
MKQAAFSSTDQGGGKRRGTELGSVFAIIVIGHGTRQGRAPLASRCVVASGGRMFSGIRPLRFYRTSRNMRTSSAGFGPERHFAPVIINGDCRGHILRSAKGFRTFDRDDREIGTYPNSGRWYCGAAGIGCGLRWEASGSPVGS